jgi:malate dehydrogenase
MQLKIGIIGAGNVGASVAHIALMKNLGDIYLLDIAADMAKGKAIDLNQSKYLFNSTAVVDGGDDYNQINDCDFVVVTAGLARKPGMSRDDLLFKNFEIVRDVCLKIKQSKKQPFVIIVSNPLDVMAYTAFKTLGYPKNRVLGMAGVLDTYRFLHNIQKKLGTRTLKIDALTLGSHGDSMVPVSSEAKVDGKNLNKLVSPEDLKMLEDKTKNGGAEIVALLKTGSAYYAPAASTVRMMEAIINNQNVMLPCSVLAEGEYGINDIFVGLPVKLNKTGYAGAINVKMNEDEKKQLAASAAAIAEQISKIKSKF